MESSVWGLIPFSFNPELVILPKDKQNTPNSWCLVVVMSFSIHKNTTTMLRFICQQRHFCFSKTEQTQHGPFVLVLKTSGWIHILHFAAFDAKRKTTEGRSSCDYCDAALWRLCSNFTHAIKGPSIVFIPTEVSFQSMVHAGSNKISSYLERPRYWFLIIKGSNYSWCLDQWLGRAL